MDKSLKHYGILGMRWGVRRTKAQLRRARGPDNEPRKLTKEEYEAEKKKAIRSGDKDTIERWKEHLTEAELREAVNRVDMNRKLNGVDKSAAESGLEKVESVMDKVGRTVNVVNTGLNAYGVVAKINNTFNSNKLPVIDGTNFREKTAKEAKRNSDFAELKTLINEGRIDEILDHLDDYDSDALSDATKYIAKKKSIASAGS